MKALLRFQAVTLARAFETPFAVLQLVALAVVVTLAACDFDNGAASMLAILLFVFTAVSAMSRTFDAIDSVRWIAPIRRGRVVSAHFRFWLAVLAPLALIVAVGHTRAPQAAAIVFLVLALAVVAAASIVILYQRIA